MADSDGDHIDFVYHEPQYLREVLRLQLALEISMPRIASTRCSRVLPEFIHTANGLTPYVTPP